jgi:hypothetical protein
MQRRSFLIGIMGAALGPCARVRAQAQPAISVAVDYEAAGTPIPSDFIGLSYESAILADGTYFTPGNKSVLNLISLLGPAGVIRIGGNTSERTVWRPGGEAAPPGSIALTPAGIDRLAAFLRAVGWKLIYGLNLARGTPEQAAEEAAYVARAVGANLLAFQIGNEPDGFGRWTAIRPKTYAAADYLAEWTRFHAAIRARLPYAPFAGPDVAAETGWVGAFAASRPPGLVLLTRHYYADGPAGAPHVSLAKLLHSDQQIEPTLQELARLSRLYSLPFRIAEANSIYNEGQPGVSNTLGAALWSIDLTFRAAAAGAAGINFHAGVHNFRPDQDKAYTPITRTGDGGYRAAPLYYGMLLFARAARGVLVPARATPASANLKAYATRASDGTLRVSLINTNAEQSARVLLDTGRAFDRARIMLLAGPAIDATADVTLGGAMIDDLGRWDPAEAEVRFAGRAPVIDVPAASAVTVTLLS